MRPGQEGMLELNLARALAATNKFEEAQPYYDEAAATAHDGLPLRAALFHRTMNLLSAGPFRGGGDRGPTVR